MTIILNKNWIFSGLLLLVSMLALLRITPSHVDPVIKLVISKNKANITSIYQKRDIESSREVLIDRLNLYHKNRFAHPKLGNIAKHTENFFVDIEHSVQIQSEGEYRFIVGSDDGFSLSINGNRLCDFAAVRGYTQQTCHVKLNKGSHLINLSYYQAYSGAGLTVQHAFGNEKPRWFGDNSKHVRF